MSKLQGLFGVFQDEINTEYVHSFLASFPWQN